MYKKKGEAPTQEENCPENEKCKDENGQVTCMGSSELRFKCTENGEFPDPKNCSRTYICTNGNDEPTEVCHCPGGNFVYPEQGLFCVPDACPRKQISCSEGANGYFELNSDEKTNYYYYYCSGSDVVEVYEGVEVPVGKSLHREFLRNKKNGKECKFIEDQMITTEPPKASEKPGITLPTTTKPTTKSPEQKPKCNASGECHTTECDCDFYECDTNLIPQRRNYRNGMIFSPKIKKCIYGDCDDTKCMYR